MHMDEGTRARMEPGACRLTHASSAAAAVDTAASAVASLAAPITKVAMHIGQSTASGASFS